MSASRTAAAASGAFLLFWPAILLPILEVERLGHRNTSSLLMGTLDLLAHGEWFVGSVVLLFSIVFPLILIEPSPGRRITRATEVLRLPVPRYSAIWLTPLTASVNRANMAADPLP